VPYLDREMARERHREWRRNNRDKVAGYTAAWRKKNPEAAKAISTRSQARRSEAAKRHRLDKYAANPAAGREKSRRYYNEKREDCLARNKAWREANPEKVRAIKLNRRARLSGAGQPRHGMVSDIEITEIIERQKGRCASCGCKRRLEMDHIMPLALGGRGDKTNFQGLCKPCNSAKHAKHPIDFNRSRGLLL